jgi:hypothetical protein
MSARVSQRGLLEKPTTAGSDLNRSTTAWRVGLGQQLPPSIRRQPHIMAVHINCELGSNTWTIMTDCLAFVKRRGSPLIRGLTPNLTPLPLSVNQQLNIRPESDVGGTIRG